MRILLFFAAFVFSNLANSQELWKDAEYGDSVEEVKEKFPESSGPFRSDNLLANGISSLMVVPVLVADRKFKASFYFDDNGLYRVVLIADVIFTKHETDATEDVIIGALVKNYGNASKHEDLNKTVLEDQPLWMMWNFKAIEIMFVPQHHDEKIMISYQLSDSEKKRMSESAAKQYKKNVDVNKTADSL